MANKVLQDLVTEDLVTDRDDPYPQSGSGGHSAIRKVKIIISNDIVGRYEARSYPHDDFNGNGLTELYEVDVYRILVEGLDDTNTNQSYEFMAPRFMPYWNNPTSPDPHYKTKGWVNAGLSAKRTIVVSKYIKDYSIHNMPATSNGAIVLSGTFYIHEGPASLSDYGAGSAGCVEIVGRFEDFKETIQLLSGISGDVDLAIEKLVKAKKLIVEIETATVPNIKRRFTREY